MENTMTTQPFSTDLCAHIQGVPSRLRATVVLMAVGSALFQGATADYLKPGGLGSRAWSPPV